MAPAADHDRLLARKARVVAVVIAGAMLLWMGAQVVGGKLGWDARYVFLFDLMAGAAFVWSLIVTGQIWRARRKTPPHN